jgi:hypothetical protein
VTNLLPSEWREEQAVGKDGGLIGHTLGTGPAGRVASDDAFLVAQVSELVFLIGAGEGNRTLMTSLEGWGSAIELRPRCDYALCRSVPALGGEDDADWRDGVECGLRHRAA